MKHFLLTSAAVLGFCIANAQTGFTPNQGQFANQEGKPAYNVLFKACGTGPGIFVTTSGLTYLFEQSRTELTIDRDETIPRTMDWSAIHMELVGASILKENIVVEDELPGVYNYYYAHCPQGILGVKSYHKVTIKNIYPGIDWVLQADNVNGVSHDFLVHPNGDHRNIVMRYSGLTATLDINEKSQLVLTSKYGTMYEGGLKVYRDNVQDEVRAYFNIHNNEVSFLIAGRRRCGLLTIDPPLQWDSLLASTGNDYAYGVAAAKDGSGDVMGCGFTDGSDFPVLNATQGTLSAQEDAVIYRLNANGTRLWSTYFGGTDIDNCKGIATDINGNCYVTGHTGSQDLPVMSSLQANFGGGVYDAFIAKYNTAGVMQWASWRGGTGNDFGTAITCDAVGTCFVAGYTGSTNFPVLNAIHPAKANVNDGFIFSVNGLQVMQWSTYYGGNDEDRCYGVALDAQEQNLCVVGSTNSGNFPTVGNPFQLLNAQAFFTSDAFVLKMPTHGQSVVFASYCGGFDDDNGRGVTCDAAGNIYITGYTMSSDFPITDPGGNVYVDSTQNGIGVQDAFIVKCNPTGTTRLWSTYFGGTGSDYATGIAFDQFVGIYVCGFTSSTDLPVMQPADLNYYQSTQGDGGSFNDMFIAWFDVNDAMAWSSYYGSTNSENAYALSIGQQNEIFMTGDNFNEISVVKFNPGVPTQAPCTIPDLNTIVYPVPASSNVLHVDFYSYNTGVATTEILDIQGKLIKREEHLLSGATNQFVIDISSLPEGCYFLRLNRPEGQELYRFVKK